MTKEIKPGNIDIMFDRKFLRAADMEYAPGKHYYIATRRQKDDMVALKSDDKVKELTADAVSCIVILDMPDDEQKLLLSYEYRYPIGQFLLSVPAGLIDEADKQTDDPLVTAAVREIKEETGLDVGPGDRVSVINRALFSSPGMTDESNALVCAVLHPEDLSCLSQDGAEGSELFNGFVLLDKAAAMETLACERDGNGNFYPIQTWAALMYFVSDIWNQW